MEQSIENAKIELIQWLTTVQDSSIIEKLKDLRKAETKDWWNDTSEAERKSIELGIADADAGNLNSNSEAEKTYGKWL